MSRVVFRWVAAALWTSSIAGAQGTLATEPQGAARAFSDYLSTARADIPLLAFLLNLVVAALLAQVLARVYVAFGRSLSNRELFARNFMLLSLTVMLIITIVKSSLALSLGLVGALSIVRYRAAIKEPEELAYLFLAISIGLGLGADQLVITVVAFAVIVALIWLRSLRQPAVESPNLHLTLSTSSGEVGLPRIVEVLERHCTSLDLKRFDEGADGLEAAFLVQFADFEKLDAGRDELRSLDAAMTVSFLDNKGLF